MIGYIRKAQEYMAVESYPCMRTDYQSLLKDKRDRMNANTDNPKAQQKLNS